MCPAAVRIVPVIIRRLPNTNIGIAYPIRVVASEEHVEAPMTQK